MRSIMLKAAFVMALLPVAACTAYVLSLQSPFFAKYATSFYFEYTMEDTRGKVEVSGRKTPGNYYSLEADLDENTKKEAK